jgi:hypothetical protein
VDIGCTFSGVTDNDDADGVSALKVTQVDQRRRNPASDVLIDAVQSDDGSKTSRRGLSRATVCSRRARSASIEPLSPPPICSARRSSSTLACLTVPSSCSARIPILARRHQRHHCSRYGRRIWLLNMFPTHAGGSLHCGSILLAANAGRLCKFSKPIEATPKSFSVEPTRYILA